MLPTLKSCGRKNFEEALKHLKIGMIKGGQLGRMFLQAAVKYPVSVHVMDNEADPPCKGFSSAFVQGNPLDADEVFSFGRDLDAVTVEFENVNTEGLKRLEDSGVAVFPRPEIIRMIQDKGRQKELYRSLGIPTADYALVDSIKDLGRHTELLPAVQKLRVSGYDGKGVVKLRAPADLARAFDAPSVLEREIPFVKEIAVIGARGQQGDIRIYPTVEIIMDPELHLLDCLLAPANVSADVHSQAAEIVRKLLTELDYVGVLAVEMFVTREGSVLVNEISPRPHNSGHHTIEACRTSQYEQQLRALIGLPLGSTEQISAAAIVNLIGADGHSGPAVYEGLSQAVGTEGVYVHLYGKKETRPFRKMGHLTVLRSVPEEAIQIAKAVSREIKIKSSS